MVGKGSAKAQSYIQRLNAARCDGKWETVPELARKVEKHAPQRKCLAQTARAEVQVAGHSEDPTTTDETSTSRAALEESLVPLEEAVSESSTNEIDRFEALVCLGCGHWKLGARDRALVTLPTLPEDDLIRLVDSGSAWTLVCAVKGAYLRGFILEKNGRPPEASQTYSMVIPLISGAVALNEITPQLRLWSERLLNRSYDLWARYIRAGHVADIGAGLRMIRLWTKLVNGSSASGVGPPATVRSLSLDPNSNRQVWKAYYGMLSSFLQNGVLYGTSTRPTSVATDQPPDVPFSLSDEEYVRLRIQQHEELKYVQATYEALLLKETRFPKANEHNEEINRWVETVMKNWKVLCGPTWQDEELVEGGKDAVGKETLDILYRAATKTFHSTQILRHLFTVHSSMAGFDVALEAFNSYLEIMKKGKARAEKTGEAEAGLDDEDTAVRTAAQAIRILCCYGTRRDAERASDLGTVLEDWLGNVTPRVASKQRSRASSSSWSLPRSSVGPDLAEKTLAVSYRAIAVSKAHWARVTYNTVSRAELQEKATDYLHRSLAPELGDLKNIESLFALGLLLAETRDIDGAILVIKEALASPSPGNFPSPMDGTISEGAEWNKAAVKADSFVKERKLVQAWHLLALLLTAKKEFEPAMKACEAAFEQFIDPVYLFGEADGQDVHDGDQPNGETTAADRKKERRRGAKGIVDYMENFEKESIVQIKMTQLSLLEVLEGSDTAVNASDELLGLYARLFGAPKAGRITLRTAPDLRSRPQSVFSNIRIRSGSVFRRSRRNKRESAPPELPVNSIPPSITTSRPTTAATTETRTTTGQNGIPNGITNSDRGDDKYQTTLNHLDDARSDGEAKSRRSSRRRSRRSGGEGYKAGNRDFAQGYVSSGIVDGMEDRMAPQDAAASPNGYTQPLHNEVARFAPVTVDAVSASQAGDAGIAEEVDPPRSESAQRLRSIPHHFSYKRQPAPVSHSSQPPRQDTRLPVPPPRPFESSIEPKFPTLQDRRQKVSLLIDVWLFTAGLYSRASLFEDASAAVREARQLVEAFEVEVAQEESSSKSFFEKGWGGGKSVEELWADVHAEQGNLFRRQDRHHETIIQYEAALTHLPDHPAATVGLSELLLDIYCQIIAPEQSNPKAVSSSFSNFALDASSNEANPTAATSESDNTSPEALGRLAARDRAYGLLSSLTRLGAGWDNSEAWFTLARAYEESGQIEKAKEVLWWCIELEDSRPLRHWKHIGPGGYVL